jgi:NADH:ubiquinone oxidoreductase subunit 3 (subunit A)
MVLLIIPRRREESRVLENWLPFLIYGIMALAIPATMVFMSFAFATRPKHRTRARGIPFESGVSTGPLPQ